MRLSYEEFKDHYDIYSDYIYSEKWLIGGNRRDCWGGDYLITPENPPTHFEEFDNLLKKINEKITFIDYREIYDMCIYIENSEDRDYYGGKVLYSQYECNVKNLYSELIEKNLLKDLETE